MVLAEHQQNLERLGIEAFDPPPDFWETLNELPGVRGNLPRDVKLTLEKTLPDPKMDYKVVRRAAELGSRGQQRLVAIAHWNGGCIAREAKAMLPSSCVWLSGRVERIQSHYREAITAAVRSRDPFQKIEGLWLIRRLSPDSDPIEIEDLPQKWDEEALLHAMARRLLTYISEADAWLTEFCRIYAAGKLVGFVPPRKRWPRSPSAIGRNTLSPNQTA